MAPALAADDHIHQSRRNEMVRTVCAVLAGCVALLWSIGAAASSSGTVEYAIAGKISGPASVAAWDYATVDPGTRRLYLATIAVPARASGLTVVELNSEQVTPTFLAAQMPHGFAVLGNGMAALADAATNAVLFFDQGTGKRLASVDTGKPPDPQGWHNPDALLLEPKTGLLIAANKDSHALALIDVRKHSVVSSIDLDGELEFLVADGDGRVYVNIESKNAIGVVDIPGRKVVKRIPLKGCEEPSGAAYDAADRLVISVCGNGVAKFVDPAKALEVASVTVGKGADAVMYDPKRKVVFIAGGDDGKLSVLRVPDRDHIALTQTLKTQPGTRLGAVDPETGRLYLPTSKPDLAAPPLHFPGLPPIQPPLKGSFEIWVVAPRS
jgi:DNA-binding beta-propeller fold protein YncE